MLVHVTFAVLVADASAGSVTRAWNFRTAVSFGALAGRSQFSVLGAV
jgi:hypothetical protein